MTLMAAYAAARAAAFERLAPPFYRVRRRWAAPTRRRWTRYSRTPGCAWCGRARAGSRARASHCCSRSRTTAPSTCCARAAAVALDAHEGEDGEPWQPARGGAWQHWPAPARPRRRATNSRSGAAPAESCSPASTNCRSRSAAPSCCTTTMACARRCRACAGGRLRDRQDAAALRDGLLRACMARRTSRRSRRDERIASRRRSAARRPGCARRCAMRLTPMSRRRLLNETILHGPRGGPARNGSADAVRARRPRCRRAPWGGGTRRAGRVVGMAGGVRRWLRASRWSSSPPWSA